MVSYFCDHKSFSISKVRDNVAARDGNGRDTTWIHGRVTFKDKYEPGYESY